MAKPGSIPVVKQDALPWAQASVMGSTHDGGFWAMAGQTQGVIAVEQTSMPARRNVPMSAMLSAAWAAVGP